MKESLLQNYFQPEKLFNSSNELTTLYLALIVDYNLKLIIRKLIKLDKFSLFRINIATLRPNIIKQKEKIPKQKIELNSEISYTSENLDMLSDLLIPPYLQRNWGKTKCPNNLTKQLIIQKIKAMWKNLKRVILETTITWRVRRSALIKSK